MMEISVWKKHKKSALISVLLIIAVLAGSIFLYNDGILKVQRFFDSEPPSITVEKTEFELGENFSLETLVSVSDNVDEDIEVTLSDSDNALSQFNGMFSTTTVGSYKVSVAAKDVKGNSATKTFQINVTDTTPPVFESGDSSSTEYGRTIQLSSSETENAIFAKANDLASVEYAVESVVPVTENLDESSYAIVDKQSVRFNKSGVFTVNILATDASRNTAHGKTEVTVKDTKKPVITKVKDSVSVYAGSNSIDFSQYATANDEMDGDISVVADTSAVDYTVPGEYKVSLKATDASGNVSYDSVSVVVREKPVVKSTPTSTATNRAGVGTGVYITETGSCYHTATCSCLSKSKISISLNEAIAQGFKPCKRCH